MAMLKGSFMLMYNIHETMDSEEKKKVSNDTELLWDYSLFHGSTHYPCAKYLYIYASHNIILLTYLTRFATIMTQIRCKKENHWIQVVFGKDVHNSVYTNNRKNDINVKRNLNTKRHHKRNHKIGHDDSHDFKHISTVFFLWHTFIFSSRKKRTHALPLMGIIRNFAIKCNTTLN